MEIALFGGSFDPPHVGHLLAAAYVLATEPVDELWFVPVFGHPLGKPLRGLDGLSADQGGLLAPVGAQNLGSDAAELGLLRLEDHIRIIDALQRHE